MIRSARNTAANEQFTNDMLRDLQTLNMNGAEFKFFIRFQVVTPLKLNEKKDAYKIFYDIIIERI